MLSEDAIILERVISVSINSKFVDSPPSQMEFLQEANKFRSIYQVSDQEFNQIIKNLTASLLITMENGICITAPNSDHKSWLPSRRADIDFYYWNRFKRYLEEYKGWNSKVTANLDIMSNEIVDLLGDPSNQVNWQRRGLVIGDVQSGKTVNYTAICNKAADTGYKVIIVLAGMMENLRMQTQERLDKEFAGRLSKNLFNRKNKNEVQNVFDGVGKIDRQKRISAFTSVLYDFNKTILDSHDLTLRNIKEPALFVVKKNKTILKNLESWLISNNADPNGMIDLPLLLIDDEADNASVNTKKADEDPTAINAAIRSILKRFYKASYVGITATPFANIFINPDTEDEMVGDDLFPRDFIYVLSPPSNYIGPEGLFGDSTKYKDSLVEINQEEIERIFPLKHKKDLIVNELPDSLYEALGYFLLVNAIRDIRNDVTQHRSMLINVSRFTNVQINIKNLVVTWINHIQSEVRNYSGLDEKMAMEIPCLRFLRNIWEKYVLGNKVNIPWITVQQKYLHRAISPIEVRAVNQNTGASSLDYSSHRDTGFRVIAIGGMSLSRGLTLEGLVVSYFYRNSQMYDTLLQMGRWFGYRPNYEDIFKIWLSQDAIDWYGYITEASNELKREIGTMNRLKRTPSEFGLKVRQDPNSLIVTAKNKMRNATPVKRPIRVTGKLLETPRLISDKKVLDENAKAFKYFVKKLDKDGKSQNVNQRGKMWRGIDKEPIVELLRNFETHPWHLAFQSMALADYIEKNPLLVKWDVFLPNGSGGLYKLEGANGEINVLRQKRHITESDNMIKISGTKVRVGSGGIAKVGLTDEQIAFAEEEFKKSNPSKSNVPDSAYLLKDRNPLLVLHVLEKQQTDAQESNPNIPETLFALSIGFPGDEEIKTANYVVNQVELSNGMDIDIGDDEDGLI